MLNDKFMLSVYKRRRMIYRYKYKRNTIQFNLESEVRWLKRNHYKPNTIKVLRLLATSKENDLSDETLAKKLKISLSTYKRAKAELMMAGIAEVHKLNASYILILLGSNAINYNNVTYEKKYHLKMMNYVLTYLRLSTVTKDDLIKFAESEPNPFKPTDDAHVIDRLPIDYDSFQHNKKVFLDIALVNIHLYNLWNPIPDDII